MENNNVVRAEVINGILFEYDDKENLIHIKYPDGLEKWMEYDENNNMIHFKNSNGHEWYKNGEKVIYEDDTIDSSEIKILIRNLNGKRLQLNFDNVTHFQNFDWDNSEFDDDNYEILIVTIENICVYSQLQSDKITFEDLIGFFG